MFNLIMLAAVIYWHVAFFVLGADSDAAYTMLPLALGLSIVLNAKSLLDL